MEIHFELTTIEEDGGPIHKGLYLSIKSSHIDTGPIMIPYNEFESIYSASKKNSTPVLPEAGFIREYGFVDARTNQAPTLNQVVSFLKEKLNINERSFLGDNKELVVQSNQSKLLELPWESLINDNLFIVRRCISPERVDAGSNNNNLLLLMSHAYEGLGKDLKEMMEEEIKSVYKSIDFFIENDRACFKVDNIHLLKHTTLESIEKIHWEDYNFAHLIMHGDQNGNLCLEKIEKCTIVDSYSAEQFLNLIKDKCFTLIFLSMCYSGGGVVDGDSLAFKIINSGFSKYAIAYSDPVGQDSAKSFVDIFYQNLVIPDNNIEDVYRRSLKSYYELGKRRYIPLLYSSV